MSSAPRYRVRVGVKAGERIFIVVTPTGESLYSYADSATARAEAEALSMFELEPTARPAELAHMDYGER
jgi:hypothetical protein